MRPGKGCAPPEKTLLDLLYLSRNAEDPDCIAEMRFALEDISLDTLQALAAPSAFPRLVRRAEALARWAEEDEAA